MEKKIDCLYKLKKIQIFYKNNPEHVYFKTKRFGRIFPFVNSEKFAKKEKKMLLSLKFRKQL